MSLFFNVFASACALALAAALAIGHLAARGIAFSPEVHLVVGLGAAVLTVSLHCLVFAIFTGSGKDTREIVQDLHLDKDFVARTKRFKKDVFPPALYAILLLVVTTTLGGALGAHLSPWLRWLHLLVAWTSFLYQLKVLRLECQAVYENSQILVRVNSDAAVLSQTLPVKAPQTPEILSDVVDDLKWETHAYALGRFLCFLAYNVWLPYIYLRFVVGYFLMPVWPYAVTSLLIWCLGFSIRKRYQSFRPERWSTP